jgi:hypothetical protein
VFVSYLETPQLQHSAIDVYLGECQHCNSQDADCRLSTAAIKPADCMNIGLWRRMPMVLALMPSQPYVYTLASVSHDGKRRVLLINKRNRTFGVSVAGSAGGQVSYVDQTTAFQPPANAKLNSDTFNLGGFSVTVVTLP